MMYWDGDWSGWTRLAMGFSMLLFWGVVVAAIWLGMRGLSSMRWTAPPKSPETAEDVLAAATPRENWTTRSSTGGYRYCANRVVRTRDSS
jgi:hypothetical protein